MSSDLSKSEYLKRYLEGDGKEKKYKKKIKTAKSILPRIKILDQDVSIRSIEFGTKDEVEDDDVPVIAEVVDDRPVEIKSKEIYESSRWKKIGEDSEEVSTEKYSAPTNEKSSHPSKSERLFSHKKSQKQNSKKRHDSDSDLSPIRVSSRHDSDSDLSPPRKNHSKEQSSSSKRSSVSVRESHKISKSHSLPSEGTNSSPLTQSNRQKRNDSDSDLSPLRPNRRYSPDSDRKKNSGSALSPLREKQRKSSPNSGSDLSPPRKRKTSSKRDSPQKDENHRPMKTLSGLKAGLQNAATLREETKDFKERERDQIRQLDEELSGRNAGTIVRDRKTGKKRNIEEENRVDEEKMKKLSETQQKYAEWGKGIEQSENKKQKFSEDLYDMSKPFARYCDDEDLDAKLKEEIRDEDPFAEEMRKKKQKGVTAVYPVYSGPPPPPNRFNIPPGYRWDGVDRSNGFEKRYFELKSSKKAVEKEAYLWSVQDM